MATPKVQEAPGDKVAPVHSSATMLTSAGPPASPRVSADSLNPLIVSGAVPTLLIVSVCTGVSWPTGTVANGVDAETSPSGPMTTGDVAAYETFPEVSVTVRTGW